jgi:protein-arginine kinase
MNYSLLELYLPKKVYAKLENKKTSGGKTIWDCLDSGIGVYAADSECYQVFAPLFNPIIEEYHSPYKTSESQPFNLNFEEINFDSLEKAKTLVQSTRIRVARNLEGYPLTSGLSTKQRLEVEKKIKMILLDLDGEFKGNYYSLSNMDQKTQEQLIQDHFLFTKKNRFLESAGMLKDWPLGRGIFYNNAKTFLVWVNEEDHLRIISMQQGFNLETVVKRLFQALQIIGKKLPFQRDPHLGFLSSCPTNLGTALRASVHMKIPKASKTSGFQKLCKKHFIQCRGIDGELSESAGKSEGVYDLSNQRRLGLSETECIQQLCNGITQIAQLEIL